MVKTAIKRTPRKVVSVPRKLPATAAPAPEPMLDHILHAAVARFTGNLSPASIGLARHDWGEHLLFSPDKLLSLQKSWLAKSGEIAWYGMQAAAGKEVVPLAQPSPGDRRFKNEEWQRFPFNLFHQAFLLYEDWWEEATANVRGVSRHHQDVVSFTARQWLDVFSPSNYPLTNPEVLAATIAQGGRNFWHGFLHWMDDVSRTLSDQPPAGAEAFKVGENIAVTPGKVVFRNRLIEVIQYAPATDDVYAEPVLIVPAWIMKYYILDLSPENSLVKYLVGKGHTVFMISWKNPDGNDRDLSMEDYVHLGVEAALAAVRDITGHRIHTVGYCIGGTLLSIAAAAAARDGTDGMRTMTLFAAQTDFEDAGELQLFIDDSQLAFLEDVMWEQGYLDKYQMAGAFQMLRSNDLIWSRLVNDYLMGQRQPMIDLMAWNADATRMPYRMHSQYLRDLFLENKLAEGHFLINGAPLALHDIHLPVFCVGTQRDHVAPWKSVYKIHLYVDGDVTFVLTSGGHNAGIVSEPGHKGRSYQIATQKSDARYIPPGQWRKETPVKEGSWWEDWHRWLAGHSGAKQKPPAMGNADYKPLADAPGTYVFMK